VATVTECEQALHALAERISRQSRDSVSGHDRTLSCRLRDLEITFRGRLRSGMLTDIHRVGDGEGPGQIALSMTSDDLVAIVEGSLPVASAFASGRMTVKAGPMDLLRLRAMF
jgi:putative sterol carrier protein